jgi:hypothetical protein
MKSPHSFTGAGANTGRVGARIAALGTERLDRFHERVNRQHVQALDDERLRRIRARQENGGPTLALRRNGHGQHAANRLNVPSRDSSPRSDVAVSAAR